MLLNRQAQARYIYSVGYGVRDDCYVAGPSVGVLQSGGYGSVAWTCKGKPRFQLCCGDSDGESRVKRHYQQPLCALHESARHVLWSRCELYGDRSSQPPQLSRFDLGTKLLLMECQRLQPGPDCTAGSAPNLVDSLENRGLTWKAYMEDYPSSCGSHCSPGGCFLTDSSQYAARHDPFVYFGDIVNSTARC